MHEAVRDAPPSAKLVYDVLDEHNEATVAEIREEWHLAESTTHDGLAYLDEAGVLETRNSHTDARQTVYSLRR